MKLNNDKAFTLIELLIVLLIIGIGFMSITPKLFENVVEPNKKVAFYNDILSEYSKRPMKKDILLYSRAPKIHQN